MKHILIGLSLAGLLAVSASSAAAGSPSGMPNVALNCISKTVAPAALCQYGNDEETAQVFPLPHGFYGYGYARLSDTSTDITIWEGR